MNHIGLGIEHTPKADLPKNISELRFNLMKEENEEYLQAAQDEDLIEIGDASRRHVIHIMWYNNRTRISR